MDVIVFGIASAIVLGGGLGVVVSTNPVRAALSLIASFFGVAVLFTIQEAHFLAFVQIVVYAGAIVVLFLFVIMLLGVDRSEDLTVEPLVGQRGAGVAVGAIVLALILGGLFLSGGTTDANGDQRGAVAITGQEAATQPMVDGESNVDQLSRDLFTRNVLAFEATALLLTIATVGAVVLVRNRGAEDLVVDEPGTASS